MRAGRAIFKLAKSSLRANEGFPSILDGARSHVPAINYSSDDATSPVINNLGFESNSSDFESNSSGFESNSSDDATSDNPFMIFRMSIWTKFKNKAFFISCASNAALAATYSIVLFFIPQAISKVLGLHDPYIGIIMLWWASGLEFGPKG